MRVVISSRFCGPPSSANGGWVAGILAGRLGEGAAEVRLSAPPPLETELTVEVADGTATLRDGATLLATARSASLDLEVPAAIGPDEALAATAAAPADLDHPFRTCFGCGVLRHPGDALRHRCGPVPGRDGLVACPMTTDPALPHDADGALLGEVVWAALDCPSAAAVVPSGSAPHVLGTMVARIDRPILAGEPHVCIAWPLSIDGRKRRGASAILDADGRVCALASALWISLDPAPALG
jgi:hypothetical protein